MPPQTTGSLKHHHLCRSNPKSNLYTQDNADGDEDESVEPIAAEEWVPVFSAIPHKNKSP